MLCKGLLFLSGATSESRMWEYYMKGLLCSLLYFIHWGSKRVEE
jgi:hypothetical protein